MLCTKSPRIDYDAKFDVMYYICGDTSNSYGDEDVDNIVTLKDIDSDEVRGYTIMNFKRICDSHSEEYEIISNLFDVVNVRKICGI